eukprot:scaffold10212_cov127-Amphora_coffeaeformis.AAC.2
MRKQAGFQKKVVTVLFWWHHGEWRGLTKRCQRYGHDRGGNGRMLERRRWSVVEYCRISWVQDGTKLREMGGRGRLGGFVAFLIGCNGRCHFTFLSCQHRSCSNSNSHASKHEQSGPSHALLNLPVGCVGGGRGRRVPAQVSVHVQSPITSRGNTTRAGRICWFVGIWDLSGMDENRIRVVMIVG